VKHGCTDAILEFVEKTKELSSLRGWEINARESKEWVERDGGEGK
jgi:hypothetical protein